MECMTYFEDFISSINLSSSDKEALKKAHHELKDNLQHDDDTKKMIVASFLQGSYKRNTGVRPMVGKTADIDVVLVTNINHEACTPNQALHRFVPFLEKYYPGKYQIQGRSLGLKLGRVDLDLVPTAMMSNEGKKRLLESKLMASDEDYVNFSAKNNMNESLHPAEALLIPDREANTWERTNPIAQIDWTIEKNRKCNYFYLSVVKSMKWWWRNISKGERHPKSYPLEHFVGFCCPDGIDSVAKGVVSVFETIVQQYPVKPYLSDHGVPEHDVFKRLSTSEYEYFYNQVINGAKLARRAYDAEDIYDSVDLWRELFGMEFPEKTRPKQNTPGFSSGDHYTPEVPTGRFS